MNDHVYQTLVTKYGYSNLWRHCIKVFGFPPTWDLSGSQAGILDIQLDEEK